MLINQAFVPVLFSMMPEGPGADPPGRQYVIDTWPKKQWPVSPPDLLVVSPERELLGRLPFDASADETIELLRRVLRERPDLAPTDDPAKSLAYDLSDPAQGSLAAIEERWRAGERVELREPLERWIAEHADSWHHGSAVAWTLLGAARYHAQDFAGADAAWSETIERHPDHPMRHRAIYNLLDPETWPFVTHPDIAGARHVKPGERSVVVPFPEVRARNLETVRTDPRYRVGPSGLPLVEIPAGTFLMGGQPAIFPRELPVRRVTLTRPFLLAAWPITRGLWRRFRPDDIPPTDDPNADELPMARLSYADAEAFCAWISELDGLEYGMPTEAQWEFAARGGFESAPYPWGHDPIDPTRCNYLSPRPVPVACFPPNAYGLFDMVGNVQEWTADGYLENAYSLTPYDVVDPIGPVDNDDAKSRHAVRGGFTGLKFCRYMCRNSFRIGPHITHKYSARVMAKIPR